VTLPAIVAAGRALYRFSFHLLMLSVSGFWHLPDFGNLRPARFLPPLVFQIDIPGQYCQIVWRSTKRTYLRGRS
jgi:hypothetical protein